ncbi:ribonuclease HII [Candidatus Uhrbacteria bacterium]|nr:ribonuclease HII [Candidatus Uhrbacteria bacterium]
MAKIFVIGIDEVGRGSWAGPLFFAAVCFIENVTIPHDVSIRDSKALNRVQRVRSARFLRKNTIFSITPVPKGTLDEIGLQRASIRGLLSCIRQIKRKILKTVDEKNGQGIELLYKIDGRKLCDIKERHEFIVRGDDMIREISAASIIAKVARDRHITRLDKKYPEYGFDSHVGYGTKKHQEALLKYGVCEIHRTSYAPIKKILKAVGSYAQEH